MPPATGSGLKLLIEEARRRHEDTRPDMLRALVGLYLRQPSHNADEQSRFATLARHLLTAVEAPTAARALREIAPRSDLPRDFVLDLIDGPIALAGPMLRLSPVLGEEDLAALVDRANPDQLAAISARREVSPALAKRLAARMHGAGAPARERRPANATALDTAAMTAEIVAGIATELAAAFPERPAAPDRGEPRDTVAPGGDPSIAPPPAVPRLDYLAASPEERTALVARLVTLPPLSLAERVAAADGTFTDALLDLAKAAEPAGIAALMEAALGVTRENAARIVADETGQALAVAARALGLSFAVLSRVLFRLHPATGRSAAEMSRLADMFDGLPLASAQHLVASWRGGRRMVRERAEDAPSMRSYGHARATPITTSDSGDVRQQG
ncbi:hypothetical protein FHS55_000366 [Angulomicrobium tetraedrale]|uniref:DUF2336 domain-containing protein n=1 Tax=Ancylobacter tetraedralis TaxID=217068 RepID=A0A839Z5I6_9HYPH|nr:DUF2336 domain-containing protein [Ancylobacter tetraedralis]MBB3769780.1 hypothetical protein [Ancylobacter tetraedralis]